MSQAWKTVRIFISSTFRDMQAERDHLVRFVFPYLREELLRRHIHLVDVDLRWGVTSEQDALEVCREVIDECRWFLCMLGGRYGWTPPSLEMSITEAEIRYAVLNPAGEKKHCLFYFRDPQVTTSIPEETAKARGYWEFPSPEEIEKYGREQAQQMAQERTVKLAELKEAIVEAGFEPFVYPARWNAEQRRIVGLETFGDRICADLLASIDCELDGAPLEETDEYSIENAAMEAFIENRVTHYVVGSRQAILAQMTTFCQASGGPNLLEVTGEPGSGKSALLARFYLDYIKDNPDEIVIPHFIGASRNSTELRSTLGRLCHELAAQAGLRDPIPGEIKELRRAFSAILRKAADRQRVVILLDALNQLVARDQAHTMRWLPENLPLNVRVIYSSLEHPALEAARRRWTEIGQVVCGPLERGDVVAIIDKYLTRYRKRFDPEQRNALLLKGEIHSPLFLLVALEELRTLGTYEEITVRIRGLPDTTSALFDWILRRLEQGVEGQEAFGGDLVSAYTSYIAIGRGGMTEAELEGLCRPVDEENEFQFLQRMLRPYLVVQGELVTFFHSQLQEAVLARYLGSSSCHRRHRKVAQHLQQRGCDYPRTLSELAYHRYHAALLSGDSQYLFELVDDGIFRTRQLEFFGRPEPVVEEIDYAVDLAVRCHEPLSLIHFALMRVDVAAQIFRENLFQLVAIAKSQPQHAREVIAFIPYVTVRRIALLLLAWLLSEEQEERGLVQDLIADGAEIGIPASVNQVPVLLEMIRELHRAGFVDVKRLVEAIPDCPVRRVYQAIWENGPEHTRALGIEMQRTASSVPAASSEEIREFGKTQEFVRGLSGSQRMKMQPEALEEQIIKLLGPSKVADVYCLLAADLMHAGHAAAAAMLLNRGIFVSSSLLPAAIRTLAALVELFGKAGNHHLAQEHAERTRTVAGGMRRIASAEYNSGPFQDALSDLRIALDNFAQLWLPSAVQSLQARSLAGQNLPGIDGGADTFTRLAKARQLLAAGRTDMVPGLLRDTLRETEPGKAFLISTYVMAHACGDDALAADCAAQLQKHDLYPEAIYQAGEQGGHAVVVLETMAASDPRCVAAFSLGLRLEGLEGRLLELVQIASAAGAGVAILDSILAQVVRVPGPDSGDLRRIGEELVGITMKPLAIPSGLGWYYYPGIMLWGAWVGIMVVAIGIKVALTSAQLFASGVLLACAGLVGGGLDLVIWRFTDLWKRPELSRRLLLPELGSLASLSLAAVPVRAWVANMDRTNMGFGMLGALALSTLLGVIFWRNGWMFSHLSARFMATGTALSLILAGILAAVIPVLAERLVPPAVFGGVFLFGIMEMAVCLSIIPKRIAVLRYYADKLKMHESICS